MLDKTDLKGIYREAIMPSKIAFDLQDAVRQSFWLDVKIILHTVQALFAGQPLS